MRNLCFCLLLLSGLGLAAPAQDVSVSRKGQFIVSKADFVVDLPRREVIEAFSSFAELPRLNPAVVESTSEPGADGRSLVTTRLRDCVAMFCKTVTLVERVSVDRDGTIRAEVEPERGDFESGNTVWSFEADGASTRVSYRSQVRPGFWLPPLVGQRAMRAALRRQIAASVENLEARFDAY